MLPDEEYEYEDIVEKYEYANKSESTSVRYFPNRSIATITKTVEQDGALTTEIVKTGMDFEEIKKYFPPYRSNSGDEYNRALLIRSIIYEAFKKEGRELEEGNVRNFWYTHLKYIITRILGESESNSVETTIGTAWGEVINSGLVTYEGMNIIGGKESTRISVVKDSPFNNLIIAVEKEDYYNYFKWIPCLFNCTLITAGGEPSRAVARAFIKQLRDLGVNLDQQFYMCVASDLDPAGYDIQDAFRKQLEAAIRFYGGSGKVKIIRLFVRKDQVTKELLEAVAMPCKDKGTSEKAIKAEDTKWKNFCEESSGGLYIPRPDGWDGPIEIIDGKEMVRALLEMNAFSKKTIEDAIIRELLKIIEETNDESKIMIPEIMRVFELMREETTEDIYKDWHRRLIQPLIDKYLEDTNRWNKDIEERYDMEYEDARAEKEAEEKPIEEKYDQLILFRNLFSLLELTEDREKANNEIETKEQEARDRVPDLFEYREYLDWMIKELEKERHEVNDEIDSKCADIFSAIYDLQVEYNRRTSECKSERDRQIKEWKNECEEELEPIEEDYAEEEEEIEKRRKYREHKLEKFKEEHAAVFNPIEMLLKNVVAEKLSSLTGSIYFRDFERMGRFQTYIAEKLTNPNLLLVEGISCFDHPTPAFTEDDLLRKAAAESYENIGGVRKAFPKTFMEEMKDSIKELAGREQFELKGELPTANLTDEINEAMRDTEEEIEEEEIP
jgi:hypothetical protein